MGYPAGVRKLLGVVRKNIHVGIGGQNLRRHVSSQKQISVGQTEENAVKTRQHSKRIATKSTAPS